MATIVSPANVVSHPEMAKILRIVGLCFIVFFAVISLTFWGTSVFADTFDVGQMFLVLLVGYLSLSFREVGADEVAASFSYGKALKMASPGLHFVPFGLMQIRKGPRTVQEFQCPGEPEKVQKTGDEVPLADGMVRPIRVVTGGPSAGNTDAILNTRMTITLSFFVQWAITDILLYASNYGSSSEIEKQVRDIGEAILSEIAVRHSPAGFIDNLSDVNKELVSTVTKRFRNSGVRIIATRLISPDVSHEVSKALADIPKVRAEAEQAKHRAEGEKVSLTKQGEGKAAAELALLRARSKGQKDMAVALGVSGEAILASEAVRGLSDKTDVLVVGAEGGMKDVMGLVKGAQSALNIQKGVTP